MYKILSIANVIDITNKYKEMQIKKKQRLLKSFLQNYNSWKDEYGIECFVLLDKLDRKGDYYISNYGTCLSFCRNEWKILKWDCSDDGRPKVEINYKKYYVYRLVAYCFMDLDINNSNKVVHHKDQNVCNNYVGNLFIMDKVEHDNLHKELRKLESQKVKENENNC